MSESGTREFKHFETATVGLRGVPSPELSRVIGETVAGGDGALSRKISEAALQLFSYQTKTVRMPLNGDYEAHTAGDYFTLQRYRQSLALHVQPTKIPLLGAEEQGSVSVKRSEHGASFRLTMDPNPTERKLIVADPLYKTDEEKRKPELGMFLNIPEFVLPTTFSTDMALNSLTVYLLKKQREFEDRKLEVLAARKANPKLEIGIPANPLYIRRVALQYFAPDKKVVLPYDKPVELISEMKKAS